MATSRRGRRARVPRVVCLHDLGPAPPSLAHTYIRTLYEHVGLLEEQIERANVRRTRGLRFSFFTIFTLSVCCVRSLTVTRSDTPSHPPRPHAPVTRFDTATRAQTICARVARRAAGVCPQCVGSGQWGELSTSSRVFGPLGLLPRTCACAYKTAL